MKYQKAANIITNYVSKNDIKFENREEIDKKYQKFQDTYGPNVLKNLKDEEILEKVFMHDGNTNNLCYALEFGKEYKEFGSIGGGSAYKYGLFKNSEGQWIAGASSHNKRIVSEDEAIIIGKEIINCLIKSCDIIDTTLLKTPKDYKNLESELNKIFENSELSPSHSFVHKYFFLNFPEKFVDVHNDNWRDHILNTFYIESDDSSYYNEGQIFSIIKLTNLNSYEFVYSFYEKYGRSIPNYWLLAPGKDSKLWDTFQKEDVIAIGWGNIGNLNNFKNEEDIKVALKTEYGKDSNSIVKALNDFSKNMEVGDKVIIKTGQHKILGIGEITSDYYILDSLIEYDDYNHIRNVKWLKTVNDDVDFNLPIKTLTNYSNTKKKEKILSLIDMADEAEYVFLENDDMQRSGENSYTKENFLEEVLFLESDYDELVDLLHRKKNLILQGAPGVGKTYIAKRLAYSIMGKKDESKIEFIQFHQSYSYEDFIQGYKPTKDGFELQNGVFYNFCKIAENDPSNNYYFIIDEINRGNISKIFGELMMLIEEDKRGKDFEMNLTYGSEKFHVPENLYIIGMMNTADRSIAMIDYALRRRFVFYNINPLFEEDILKNHFIENKNMNEKLANIITEKISKLNRKILKDEDLGFGFRIGHSYFLGSGNYDEDWYKSIIQYEVAPILKEYWFDDLEKAESEIKELYDIND